jgi:hypothetical protein
MQGKRFFAVVSIILMCSAVTACNFGPDRPPPLTYDEAVKKVIFTGDLATVDFTNLNNHDIYLVMINSSDSVVPAANTGGTAQSPSTASSGTNHGTALAADTVPYDTGDKRNFWVERNLNGNAWVNKQATLMASGEHGNIWIMDENTSSGTSEYIISIVQAQEMAGRFDQIYRMTTNLLGFENGGGLDGDGGTDGDKKIQILVFDFNEADYGPVGTTYAGYFSPKDFYTQAEVDRLGWNSRTNLAEMFYLNARYLINSPDYIYSVLIHELQHMINYTRKHMEHDLNADTWYNEMLSTMAEDVIGPLIGIGRSNPGHPILMRLPRFLDSYYMYGITEWNDSSNNYSNVYAFGAYLLRNYGGPELLKRILDNDKVNIDSLTSALEEFSGGMDFTQAFIRYGEALIFSGSSMPEGAATFDRTVTSTVNGQVYTAYGFDIWQMSRRSTGGLGPLVLGLESSSMKPHSVVIQSTSRWRRKTGDFSITLEKPSDQDVVLYLMAR